MAYTDLIYFQADADHRLLVEFLIDNGNPASDSDWVDFNARYASAQPDYYAGLINRPTITEKTEDRVGVYVSQIDALRFKNDPWNGNAYGFWDALLPITVRGKTFSTWRRRKVRIRVETVLPDGTRVVDTLGIFRVKNVETTIGEAEVTLVGVHQVLMTTSAATIKDGTRWYQSHPIGALIKRLATAADPSMEVNGCDSVIDMGTMDVPVASSWGPCPGVLVSGVACSYHWIPRCFAVDADDDSVIWVGFESPGSQTTSSGGIAKFDCITGRWTIVAHPDSYWTAYTFRTRFPISLWAPTGNVVYYTSIQERANVPTDYLWYDLKGGVCAKDGSAFEDHVTSNYWPARFALRIASSGLLDNQAPVSVCGWVGDDMYNAGGWANKYYGESIPVAFPQTLDRVRAWEILDPSEPRTWWNGYGAAGTDLDNQIIMPRELGRPGHYTMRTVDWDQGMMPRFFMGDFWHAPQVYRMSGTDRMVWMGQKVGTPLDFTVHRWGVTEYTVNTWNLSLGDGNDLWKHHVTAWGLAPGQTGSSLKLLAGVIDWDEGIDTTMRRSTVRLAEITAAVDGGDNPIDPATYVDEWTYSAPTASYMPTIVSIYTPYKSGYNGQRTEEYTIVGFLNRGSTEGPCFGLGVWSTVAGGGWVERYLGTYRGPVSSVPFAGFTLNHDDGKVYFTDQATGQVHSVQYHSATDTVTWSIENLGRAAHQTEYYLSTIGGVYLKPTDDLAARVFWGMAPGPRGDVHAPCWFRNQTAPASSRYQPGLYPLIQFSRKIADAIEVAEFDGMFCWKAITDLKQRAPAATLRVTRTAALELDTRDAGDSIGTLVLKANRPFPEIGSNTFPFWSYSKRVLWDDVVNSVVVTPWMVQPVADPQKQEIRSGGSTFKGEIRYLVTTERPIRLSILCHKGCDLGTMTDGQGRNAVALFTYSRVLETLSAYLTLTANATATTITVSGFHIRGNQFYCGDQQVRVGDTVSVFGGTTRTIQTMTAVTDSGEIGASVRITLSGAIAVTARAGAKVEITPHDGAYRSDSEQTTLASVMSASATTFNLTDASMLRKHMVIKIDQELMKITAILGNTLTVVRGRYGTINYVHSSGTSVSAFLAIHEANAMYEVGDTGIAIGVFVGKDLNEPGDRSIAPGDGLLITSRGYALQKNEAAIVNVVSAKSIADFEFQESTIGDSRRKVEENRFIDLTLASLIGSEMIDTFGDPRIGLFGVKMPFFPTVQTGKLAEIVDTQIVPGGAEDFEITGVVFRTSDWTQLCTLRSIAAASGVGKRADEETEEDARGGYAVPREADR